MHSATVSTAEQSILSTVHTGSWDLVDYDPAGIGDEANTGTAGHCTGRTKEDIQSRVPTEGFVSP